MPAVKARKKKRRQNPTKQGFPDKVGYKKPPKSKQFGEPDGNPRHNGAWKKEDTLRYKLEKLINGLDDGELEEILNDPKTAPGVRRLAILLYRSNYEKPESEWRVWESALNQAYGLPKQAIEQTNLEPPLPLSPRNAPTEPLRIASEEPLADSSERRKRQRTKSEPSVRAKGVVVGKERVSATPRQTAARNTTTQSAKPATLATARSAPSKQGAERSRRSGRS